MSTLVAILRTSLLQLISTSEYLPAVHLNTPRSPPIQVHRGLYQPQPHDMARRLWTAVPQEQLPGPVLNRERTGQEKQKIDGACDI